MLFGRRKRRIERLLIVEDEPLVAFDTEHFLIGEGFAIVATVDSVAAAVRAMEGGGGIDLVLVDIDLADGNGIEVARAAQGRGIAVLFVTGNCPVDAQALAAGCLTKPYQQRDLFVAIRAIEAVIEGGKVPRRLPDSFSLFGTAG
ncbi:response regulator [Sphingomonas sp. dw_22]|uniref:response regulator n=1 Tax=Sphingomonas sp. dw_22 TaxID=2721175 RepID=UPI001BD3E470|nr:response regulator [Sphingomonas sp. dw_22]